MIDERAMRASDRDRELATRILPDAYVAGRLDLNEFHRRVASACSSQTWGQLCNVIVDLPEGRMVLLDGFAIAHARMRPTPHPAPKRQFNPLWVIPLIWLAIAAAAHVVAAIPLGLSVFVWGVVVQWRTRRHLRSHRVFAMLGLDAVAPFQR